MNKTPAFFFDTADTDYIAGVWKRVSHLFPASAIRGVTTNPNAFSKVGVDTIEKMKRRVDELCTLMSSLRPDGGAVVYVQQPSSSMTAEAIREWAMFVKTLGDGKTPIALKITPFPTALALGRELRGVIETNVTGVADCATALRAFSYGVRYVSIIVGRMEEVGVDAKAQVEFVQQRCPDDAEIISGSMRTIEGLKWTCELGTVPTIGSRVWDALLNDAALDALPSFWSRAEPAAEMLIAPTVGQSQIDLSNQFFEQMDGLGASIHQEFATARAGVR